MVEISMKEGAGIARREEPVRCGVPFARGELRETPGWQLEDMAGHPVGFAARPVAYWDDGSIKWLLVDFQASVDAGQEVTYKFQNVSPQKSKEVKSALHIWDSRPEKLVVSTGKMTVTFRRSVDASPTARVESEAGSWELDLLGANLDTGESGSTPGWQIAPQKVDCQVEFQSALRAVIRLAADLVLPSGQCFGRVICRVHCLANADYVILDHTYINGLDIRKRLLKDAGIIIRVPRGNSNERGEVRFGVDGATQEEPTADTETGLRLFQTNADRPEPLEFNQFVPRVFCSQGYDSRGPEGRVVGGRLDGWAAWRCGNCQLTLAVEDLWQQYPKEIVLGQTTAIKLFAQDEVEPGKLDIDWRVGVREEDISPTGAPWRSYGEDGVAKSHRIWVGLHRADHATTYEEKARAFQQPLLPGVSPERIASTGALGRLAPVRPDAYPQAERFLQGLTEWIWRHQSEWSNWYGMVNWGGLQTHYLPVEGRWTNLIERFGWLNGETEPQLGVLLQYVRTRDTRWLRVGAAMVRHLVDVDTVHLGERAGNMRRHFAVHFGQPGDMSHTFLGAPCLLYFLTGDERVREVIQQVADLSRSYFSEGYERDSTDAMKNCLWFYELSGDVWYREHAESILESSLTHIAPDGGVGIPHDTGFHTNFYLLSALLLYDRMLGSEKIQDALLRIMDYEISPRGRDDDPGVSRGASYEGLTFAYYQTRNPRYLYPGIKDLAASISFSNVYQTFKPTIRFPSGNTIYYRPFNENIRPDSYSSMHWAGRLLTMIPYFLSALHEAGIHEDNLPVDGGICASRSPFIRNLSPTGLSPGADTGNAPVLSRLRWDAPGSQYPGGDPRTGNPARQMERRRFQPLDLSAVYNRAPLAPDPFGYDSQAIVTPQMLEAVEHVLMGSIQDNLIGLPWGVEAVVGGVPFQLHRCIGTEDRGMLVLEKGYTYRVPVRKRAEKLHFLGHVAGSGDLSKGTTGAIYQIIYANGDREELPLQNLIHYEDWRYLHYATQAPLGYAWYPKAFSLVPADANRLVESKLDYLQKQLDRQNADVGDRFLRASAKHIGTPFGHPLITVSSGPHAGEYYWFAHRPQKTRHLNLFSLDTRGRDIAEVRLQDTGEGHQVFLVAITAESSGGQTGRDSPAGRLSFPQGRATPVDRIGNLPLSVSGWACPPAENTGGDGAVFQESTGLCIRTSPGRHYITLTLSGGPVVLSLSANGRQLGRGFHLLGNWCRDFPDPVQQVGFEVEAPGGEVELRMDVDPELLYCRALSFQGGHGWVWDQEACFWKPRVPEPWRLLAIDIELLPEDKKG